MASYRDCFCNGIVERFTAEIGRYFDIDTLDRRRIVGELTAVDRLPPPGDEHWWPAHGARHQRCQLTIGGDQITSDEIRNIRAP